MENSGGFPEIKGAKKLSPLEMNKLDILKDHTVITFGALKVDSE